MSQVVVPLDPDSERGRDTQKRLSEVLGRIRFDIAERKRRERAA